MYFKGTGHFEYKQKWRENGKQWTIFFSLLSYLSYFDNIANIQGAGLMLGRAFVIN